MKVEKQNRLSQILQTKIEERKRENATQKERQSEKEKRERERGE